MDYEGLRGQSAIEYLMTYGWMLLVVAVVGGAVFSVVGDQSIENVQGFNSQEVNVEDFGVSTENGLMFSMSDPIGQTTVTEVTVSNSNSNSSNITYILNQDVSEQNTVNLPGIAPGEGSNELEVDIMYDSGNLENLTTLGTVTGNLEVNENFNNRTMILNGLVGYWPLDEAYTSGSTVYDVSRNQNHGLIEGNPVTGQEGVIGESFEFDGENDYIETIGSAEITDETFSVAFWSFVPDLDSLDSRTGFVGGDGSSGKWYITEESDGFRVRIWSEETPIITESMVESDWQHNIFVIQNKSGSREYEYYKNGELTDSDSSIQQIEQPSAYRFGVYTGSGTSYLEGRLDDIRVYNRVLSEEEAEMIYEQGDK